MIAGWVVVFEVLGCTGRGDDESAGPADSESVDAAEEFECGVSLPEGLRPVFAGGSFSTDAECQMFGVTRGLYPSATELDAFVGDVEACAGSLTYGVPVSDAVDWTQEFVVAATANRTYYGFRLGALGAHDSGATTHVDWCFWRPSSTADSFGTQLVVYALPNTWPTNLEDTVTKYQEE